MWLNEICGFVLCKSRHILVYKKSHVFLIFELILCQEEILKSFSPAILQGKLKLHWKLDWNGVCHLELQTLSFFLPNLTLLPCYLWMTLHLLPRHTDYSQGYNPARIQMIPDLWRFPLCKMHLTMQEKIQMCLLYTAKFNTIRKMDYYYYFSFPWFGCPELNNCITRKEERKALICELGIVQG